MAAYQVGAADSSLGAGALGGRLQETHGTLPLKPNYLERLLTTEAFKLQVRELRTQQRQDAVADLCGDFQLPGGGTRLAGASTEPWCRSASSSEAWPSPPLPSKRAPSSFCTTASAVPLTIGGCPCPPLVCAAFHRSQRPQPGLQSEPSSALHSHKPLGRFPATSSSPDLPSLLPSASVSPESSPANSCQLPRLAAAERLQPARHISCPGAGPRGIKQVVLPPSALATSTSSSAEYPTSPSLSPLAIHSLCLMPRSGSPPATHTPTPPSNRPASELDQQRGGDAQPSGAVFGLLNQLNQVVNTPDKPLVQLRRCVSIRRRTVSSTQQG